MAEFRMPSLGADMDAGTVLEWLVAPGDEVHRGDPVAVIDTAKAAVEVEVFDDGVVDQLLVPVGEHVAVGTPLATLRAVDGAADAQPAAAQPDGARPAPAAAPSPAPAPAAPAPAAVPAPALSPAPAPSPAAATGAQAAVAVTSPLVRHLAHQHGVDLTTVAGTGPDGAVTRADVERASAGSTRISPYARRRAAELGVDLAGVIGTGRGGAVRLGDVEAAAALPSLPPPASPAPATPPTSASAPPQPRPPLDSAAADRAADRQQEMRRVVGALMARSKREIPHYYLSTTVDLERATSWLREANRDRPPAARLLPAALLLKAVALACRRVPDLNGTWEDGGFVPARAVHLGVAVALRSGGLVTPALLDADTLDLDELMSRLRDLVSRARAGRLRRSELTDATITVTNLGDRGVEAVYGVIYPPQVALVGFGKVVDRPCAVDGLLGVRPTVTATLSADHRASDGHLGARFLETVDHLLAEPARL